MEGAVGSSAAVLAAAAAGSVALVALILLWRTRAELREIRVARWWHGQGEWQSPMSFSPAPEGEQGSLGEPATGLVTTAPADGGALTPGVARETAPQITPETTSEITAETTSEITPSYLERTPVPAGPVAGMAETLDAPREELLQPAEVVRDAPEGSEPLELLLELVEDDEPGTRRDAVTALAGIRGAGRAERLTLVLGRDPSAEVRREAVAALRGSMERRRSGPADE